MAADAVQQPGVNVIPIFLIEKPTRLKNYYRDTFLKSQIDFKYFEEQGKTGMRNANNDYTVPASSFQHQHPASHITIWLKTEYLAPRSSPTPDPPTP